jgi:Citrate lyase beta subunit
MLAKAPSLAADEAIVDLEDAVAAGEKEAARELAVTALRRGPLGRTTALRVNGRT